MHVSERHMHTCIARLLSSHLHAEIVITAIIPYDGHHRLSSHLRDVCDSNWIAD